MPRTDGAFALSGEKMWTTNAAFAALFVLFASVPEQGLTAFLLERTTPGLTIGREERKLGIKGSSTCRLTLDGAVAPAENVAGGVGEGARAALDTFSLGRLKIAASALGQSKRGLEIAARYARVKDRSRTPVIR